MKTHLFIILSMIFSHTHAMEREVQSTNSIDLSILLTYPTEILDLIAQFLPFYDIEFEEEFIKRTKALTKKKLPKEYQRYRSSCTKYTAYSPDNAIIALSNKDCVSKYDTVCLPSENQSHNLTIINRKTNKLKTHRIGNFHEKLAVSCDGNLIATIYTNYDMDPSTRNAIYQDCLCITNFSTNKEECHEISQSFQLCDKKPTISFNKQGTNIIVHPQDSHYKIFPLTINTPNPNADHKKKFAKYCVQQGICKDLNKQISHIKSLTNK